MRDFTFYLLVFVFSLAISYLIFSSIEMKKESDLLGRMKTQAIVRFSDVPITSDYLSKVINAETKYYKNQNGQSN